MCLCYISRLESVSKQNAPTPPQLLFVPPKICTSSYSTIRLNVYYTTIIPLSLLLPKHWPTPSEPFATPLEERGHLTNLKQGRMSALYLTPNRWSVGMDVNSLRNSTRHHPRAFTYLTADSNRNPQPSTQSRPPVPNPNPNQIPNPFFGQCSEPKGDDVL